MVTWPPLVAAGASCAAANELAMRRPMARSAVTFNVRFMGYLTKYAPEGELEPWRLTWQFLQLFSTKREPAVGKPLAAPVGTTRAPAR